MESDDFTDQIATARRLLAEFGPEAGGAGAQELRPEAIERLVAALADICSAAEEMQRQHEGRGCIGAPATTEDRSAAEGPRVSWAGFAAILGSAMDAVITIDADQSILFFNAAAERVFRCPAAEVLGQPIDRFIPEALRARHRDHVRAFGRSNATSRQPHALGSLIGIRADGEEFPMEAAISQAEVAGQKLFTVILRDTTERQQAEAALRASREQLRALAAHLESVREEERTRIAREIHDELGQILTGLRFDLTRLATHLPEGQQGSLRDEMRAMLTLVDSSIQAVRRIATDLRPRVLDDLGLVAALEWQAQEFQGRTGIPCRFLVDEAELGPDPKVDTAVFRICQETLTNVARHAAASHVTIRLREDAGVLVLTVADNGRGITDRGLASRTSLGLLGMRERARLLGGMVSIEGRPGGGTTVSVQIPLTPPGPRDTGGTDLKPGRDSGGAP